MFVFDFDFFKAVANRRILVAGDVMLDKFYFANLDKFSSDAPIPVAKIHSRQAFPGGAANVARCLSALGNKPLLAGFVGQDHNCESLSSLLFNLHINSRGLVFSDHPTTTKTRIIAKNHQVFRLDFDVDSPYHDDFFTKLTSYIHHVLNHSLDAIVLADYEKGVCSEHFCHYLITDAHIHGVPVIVLPYGDNWIKYQGADFIVANIAKLNRILLAPADPADDDACANAANYVRRKFLISNCLATRSAFGLTLATSNYTRHFSTHKQLLVDPAGAADASVAAATAAVACGLSPDAAATFSNLVAGIAVSKPGSYAPTARDILQ